MDSLFRIWTFFTIIGFASGAAPPAPSQFGTCTSEIDYTHVRVNPKPGHTIEMGAVGSNDVEAKTAAVPFSVELISLNKREYSINEAFVYTIRVVNPSAVSLLLPVSGRPIYKSDAGYPAGYRHVYVEFQIHDDSGENAVVDTYTLYGSLNVHGSLLRLNPGDCALLHIPGFMQIYNNAQRGAVMSRDATTIAATLNLYLFDPTDSLFRRAIPPAVSNPIKLMLRGQKVPLGSMRKHAPNNSLQVSCDWVLFHHQRSVEG